MIKDRLIQILEETKKEIISNIDSQKIKASGRTQKSLKVEDRGNVLVLFSDGSGAPITTTQYGREGGKVPFNMSEIIIQWMKDKGIKPDPIPYKTNKPHKYTPIQRGYMQRAYFISKKIKQSGTNRHKQPNENVYSKAINKAMDKIRKEFTFEVTSQIRK